MKKSKFKKIAEKIRRFLDKGYDKKIKDKEDIVEHLKDMKKREDTLKEKLLDETDEEKIKKINQELEVINLLRQKAVEKINEITKV